MTVVKNSLNLHWYLVVFNICIYIYGIHYHDFIYYKVFESSARLYTSRTSRVGMGFNYEQTKWLVSKVQNYQYPSTLQSKCVSTNSNLEICYANDILAMFQRQFTYNYQYHQILDLVWQDLVAPLLEFKNVIFR